MSVIWGANLEDEHPFIEPSKEILEKIDMKNKEYFEKKYNICPLCDGIGYIGDINKMEFCNECHGMGCFKKGGN